MGVPTSVPISAFLYQLLGVGQCPSASPRPCAGQSLVGGDPPHPCGMEDVLTVRPNGLLAHRWAGLLAAAAVSTVAREQPPHYHQWSAPK